MPNALAQDKLSEARFFLGLMGLRDASTNLELASEFQYCLNAFLAATKSVTDVLIQENQRTFTPRWEAWRDSLDKDLRNLCTAMSKKRDLTVHHGKKLAMQDIKMIPAILATTRQRGPHSPHTLYPHMYDQASTMGVAFYSMKVEGRDMPALETCQQYLGALEVLVQSFGG